MVRRNGGFIKTQRIADIKKYIVQQSPKPIALNRLVLWVEANIGLTKVKAQEYIEVAVDLLGLIVDGDVIRFEPA